MSRNIPTIKQLNAFGYLLDRKINAIHESPGRPRPDSDQIGDIVMRGYEMDDPRYLLCDGKLYGTNEYPELFYKTGYFYGGGRSEADEPALKWTLSKYATVTKACLQSVCWSQKLGVYVAVGYAGARAVIYTSPDCVNWTLRLTTTENAALYSVCWSPEKSMFVAVGNSYDPAGIYYTSSDGIAWTLRHTNLKSGASGNRNSYMYSVCWSPEKSVFVAVGYWDDPLQSYGAFYTSPDGITWTQRATNEKNANLRGVCWSKEKGIFVAVGYNGGFNAVFFTSPDGITWTLRQTNTADSQMYSVCWSPEKELFVAVGRTTYYSSENCDAIYTSPDGTVWTSGTVGSIHVNLASVCWVQEVHMYIAVGTNYDIAYGQFYVSTDGSDFELRQSITGIDLSCIQSVCWSSELRRFAAVGYNPDNGIGIVVTVPALPMPRLGDKDQFAVPSNNDVIPYAYIRATD